jgi:hypothetical protein
MIMTAIWKSTELKASDMTRGIQRTRTLIHSTALRTDYFKIIRNGLVYPANLLTLPDKVNSSLLGKFILIR